MYPTTYNTLRLLELITDQIHVDSSDETVDDYLSDELDVFYFKIVKMVA